MVDIPAGSFRMGCVTRGKCDGDEKPVHEVRVDAFALSKHEVTFAQWDVCTEYGNCSCVSDEGWGRDDRPVVNVSWHDAQTYVVWLSRETGEAYRLPSEAEWEYAARAGTETRYSWGNDLGRGKANCDGCRSRWDDEKTAPVGSFPPNGFGLYDVHGNAYEWPRTVGTTATAERRRLEPCGRVATVRVALCAAGRGGRARNTSGYRFAGCSPQRSPTELPAFASLEH